MQDSAAWVSIVPALGIEVARVLLTPDSLKMMDKVNDQFFLGDTAAARMKFGLQPSLSLLQQALLGRPIGLAPSEKYRSDREEGMYVLQPARRNGSSSARPRTSVRAIRSHVIAI